MLSPLSVAFAASPVTGANAVIFMSGSGTTMVGSSPGCHRPMLTRGPPSEDEPKNRLAVLILKPSRERDGSMAVASGAAFVSSRGWGSNDRETSYCFNGGALIAACNSGSSGARTDAAGAAAAGAASDGALAVFMFGTEA